MFLSNRSVTHANSEWCVLTVSSAVSCLFDHQTTVSCYNFKLDKDIIHAGLRTGIYGCDMIQTIKRFWVLLSNTNSYICTQLIGFKYCYLLTDKIKCSFFQAVVVLILLYGCTTWTLAKCMEKRLDGNYTRMLRAVLNNSWRQHPTKQQLYGHLPPITKTIQVRQTRHAGHCWRSKVELMSDILLWTSSYGKTTS